MKTVFTTGEAAKICKVSQQTIIRCFDNGQLRGFRVPGSKFRRIPREALYKFMKDNGIPTDALEGRLLRVMIIDHDEPRGLLLKHILERDGRFEIHCADSTFSGGTMAQSIRARVLFVRADVPGYNRDRCLAWMQPDKALDGATLVEISEDDPGQNSEGFFALVANCDLAQEQVDPVIAALAKKYGLADLDQ